jgi:molybdopterin/thiamine biosynthesis adenylyltransferase
MKSLISRVRFSDAPWASKTSKNDVLIGGSGGIGSWTALALSRAGYPVTIYDMDVFNDVNLAGQFCTKYAVHEPKVNHIKTLVEQFNEKAIILAKNEEYTESSKAYPISIAGFDNMEARKIMFENWLKLPKKQRVAFIDGRLTAEFFEVFCVRTEQDIKNYQEEHLFPSSEANELPCTFKSTSHNAMGIAYLITGLVNNILVTDNVLRETNFHTRFDIGIMMFEVIP